MKSLILFTIILITSKAYANSRLPRDVIDDVDNVDDISIEQYATRYPYPKIPIDMNWSYERSTQSYDQPKVYEEINALLTQLIEKLSLGDPTRKRQLTVKHNWVPFQGVRCFDNLRYLVSTYCVEWKKSEYVQRYAYLLVNMCNAAWINEEDIQEAMFQACENKRIPDDKCA